MHWRCYYFASEVNGWVCRSFAILPHAGASWVRRVGLPRFHHIAAKLPPLRTSWAPRAPVGAAESSPRCHPCAPRGRPARWMSRFRHVAARGRLVGASWASDGRHVRWVGLPRFRHVAARAHLRGAPCVGWVCRGFARLPPVAARGRLEGAPKAWHGDHRVTHSSGRPRAGPRAQTKLPQSGPPTATGDRNFVSSPSMRPYGIP